MSATEILTELLTEYSTADGLAPRELLKTFGPPPSDAALPEDPFRRLIRVAVRGDRRTAGGLGGHQAAIRRLFPQTPLDAVCAFCVSEDRGPHPKYINSTLTPTDDPQTLRLNGIKRWGSIAPDADLLYVAASVGRDGDRNDLRMVALPADRAGITLDLEPYLDYGSTHRIADVHLVDVEVSADEVLPADAYETYIKPFRLIEDVYNTAGVQVALFSFARNNAWPQEQLETLISLVVQANAISSTDMASPSSVLLLSAYLEASEQFWHSTWADHSDVSDEVAERWQPERGLLGVAAAARETRRQNAWAALATEAD